jgi:hypothetical protein
MVYDQSSILPVGLMMCCAPICLAQDLKLAGVQNLPHVWTKYLYTLSRTGSVPAEALDPMAVHDSRRS